MTEIQPIQTRYKGILFRSRTEARWAVYFDAMKFAWEYEKEGFSLPSGQYLPDFWLPQVKMWAEVKPFALSDVEYAKCSELVAATGHECLMLIGPPANKPYSAIDRSIGECTYALSNDQGYVTDEGRFFSFPPDDSTSKDAEIGVRKALSARFEFGETGAV